MTSVEENIKKWHFKKFGYDFNGPATFRKLCEEVGELGEAMMNGTQEYIDEEAGDVLFTLTHIIREITSDKCIINSLEKTLDKNEKRLEEKIKKGKLKK